MIRKKIKTIYNNVLHLQMNIRSILNMITYLDELFDKFQQQTTKKLGCKKPEKS